MCITHNVDYVKSVRLRGTLPTDGQRLGIVLARDFYIVENENASQLRGH